jgi:hypothetical protein
MKVRISTVLTPAPRDDRDGLDRPKVQSYPCAVCVDRVVGAVLAVAARILTVDLRPSIRSDLGKRRVGVSGSAVTVRRAIRVRHSLPRCI